MNGPKLAVALALVLGACNGDAQEGGLEALLGHWELDDQQFLCTTFFSVLEDSRYAFGQVCTLMNGGSGVSVEYGDLEVDDDTLRFSPTSGSCADAKGSTYPYRLDGDSLRIVSASSSMFTLKRTDRDPSQVSPSTPFGCFDNHGNFTAREVVEY